jgi:haloacetate dehalogenase
MFEGFADEMIRVGQVSLRVRYGGEGPAVLLIHGHPRTGATWHRLTPDLVKAGFTVVCPDMRGYGQSTKPKILADHSQQSKRSRGSGLRQVDAQTGTRAVRCRRA